MNNIIGERLKIVRNSLNMKTQSQFADKLGINQTTLSKYENGTSDVPDDIKVKISNYGINLHWLLTGEGNIYRNQEQEKNTKDEKHPLISNIEVLIKENIGEIESRLSVLESKYAKLAYLPENKPYAEYPITTGNGESYTKDPEPEYGEVPYRKDIAAGLPIIQSEDESLVVDVPLRFIKTRLNDYYALRVIGNSMIDANIPDGSLALIRKSDVPRHEAIQVVRIDGKATLKRLREKEDHNWLICYEDGSGRTIPFGEENFVQGDFVVTLPPLSQPRMRGEL